MVKWWTSNRIWAVPYLAVISVCLTPLLLHAVTMQALQPPAVDWTAQTVRDLYSQNLDGRMRVLESDMFEVKWLTRLLVGTMVTMVFTTARGARKS